MSLTCKKCYRMTPCEECKQIIQEKDIPFLSELRYELFRKWYRELKNKPCMDCGNKFPPEAMHFAHIDPKIKRYNISELAALKHDSLILKEIENCDLLCSNCHNIRHAKEKKSRALN